MLSSTQISEIEDELSALDLPSFDRDEDEELIQEIADEHGVTEQEVKNILNGMD